MSTIESRRYAEMAASPAVVEELLARSQAHTAQAPDTELQFDKFASSISPGRSFYSVTAKLQASCDGELTVETLVNQWPQEHYGVFCRQASLFHVHCEWGECQQYRPTESPQ